jgi:hypothetical protein
MARNSHFENAIAELRVAKITLQVTKIFVSHRQPNCKNNTESHAPLCILPDFM